MSALYSWLSPENEQPECYLHALSTNALSRSNRNIQILQWQHFDITKEVMFMGIKSVLNPLLHNSGLCHSINTIAITIINTMHPSLSLSLNLTGQGR